jgi:hypothetical protein
MRTRYFFDIRSEGNLYPMRKGSSSRTRKPQRLKRQIVWLVWPETRK